MAEKKVVYVVSGDPFEHVENVSAVFAQALTAVSFGHETSIYLMDNAVNIAKKDGVKGAKFTSFEPIETMLENFIEMEGTVFVCHPSSDARGLHEADCIDGVKFVNASALVSAGIEADALFTF